MGIKCAPDFGQQDMEEVLWDINNTGVYLYDIGAFSFTWEHKILHLDRVLLQLKSNGFTVNPHANGPSRKLIGLDIGSHPLV